jgi:DNA-binding NarL/FixJ family response regulator
MIRTVIAEDHTLVRQGMRLLLETIPDVSVVGEAADGLEILQVIADQRPDCVIMDLAMPRLSGLAAMKRSTKAFPATRILVVSMHADEPYVYQALSSGAAGYLLKGADKTELELALRLVAAGHQYLTPGISTAVLTALNRKSPPEQETSSVSTLTARQIDVLRLLAEGNASKAIAARLGVSAKTIEAHRAAIMQRLGIRDLAGLVRFAIREGLVATDR